MNLKMAQPLSLISAQVQFMDERLALVHIPLDLYPFFLQPILQLIFNEVPAIDEQNVAEDEGEESAPPSQPAFLNLSVTPVECSVVCPRHLAELYFEPLANKFNQATPANGSRVSISKEDFIVMQVDGQGLDAGQRVLELTSPLAMAGISIFFISTYFSDYILVPLRSKGHVIRALEKRGFTFEVSTEAFVNNSHSQYSTFSPTSPQGPIAQRSPPVTPPPSTLSELQTRTFASLRRHNIVPRVDKSLRLVQCAAHHRFRSETSSVAILRPALTTTLLVDKPRFLSLTLTAADPAASILLEKRLLPRFSLDPISGIDYPDEESSLLLGSKEDILVPIMLDLRDLPLEATGIVCGVAGRLAAATHNRDDLSSSTASMSSLSGSNSLNAGAAVPIPMSSSDPTPVVADVASSSYRSDTHSPSKTSPPSFHHLEPDPEAYTDAVEISFLSTARAGTVIVGERELSRAVDALDAESREPESEVEGEED